MTALSAERSQTVQKGSDPIPNYLSLGVAATKQPFQGGMVSILKSGASSGYAAPTTGTGAQVVVGRCERTADNTTGADGATTVKVRQGVFKYANGGDITALKIGEPCYASDDQTVFLADNGGARPFAGIIFDVDSNGVWVEQGLHLALGGGDLPVDAIQQAMKSAFKARGVCVTNMSVAAFIGVAGGTPQNGITYAAGDIVLLTAQTAPAENGPYVVGTVGGGVAALTRPDWWTSGSLIKQGQVIEVGYEGTLLPGSSWKALCTTALKVVDTDDPVLFPKNVKARITLAAGTKTLGVAEGFFLKSTTDSAIVVTRVDPAGTVTSTIMYQCQVAGRTAGVAGTAAAIVIAAVAAGTIANADTSTLDVLVTNW